MLAQAARGEQSGACALRQPHTLPRPSASPALPSSLASPSPPLPLPRPHTCGAKQGGGSQHRQQPDAPLVELLDLQRLGAVHRLLRCDGGQLSGRWRGRDGPARQEQRGGGGGGDAACQPGQQRQRLRILQSETENGQPL